MSRSSAALIAPSPAAAKVSDGAGVAASAPSARPLPFLAGIPLPLPPSLPLPLLPPPPLLLLLPPLLLPAPFRSGGSCASAAVSICRSRSSCVQRPNSASCCASRASCRASTAVTASFTWRARMECTWRAWKRVAAQCAALVRGAVQPGTAAWPPIHTAMPTKWCKCSVCLRQPTCQVPKQLYTAWHDKLLTRAQQAQRTSSSRCALRSCSRCRLSASCRTRVTSWAR